MSGVRLVCSRCGAEASTEAWRCPCGGALDIPADAPSADAPVGRGPWRHVARLKLPPGVRPRSLGEGETPLVELPGSVVGERLYGKLEHLSPTGSFKDRGTAVLLAIAASAGFDRVVSDSSGNMGSSVAGYAAAHGMACEVFTPARSLPAKLAQMRAYGATVVTVDGDRNDAAEAARGALEGAFYASHYWNPYFMEGTSTAAYEIWEQLGRVAPDHVVVPVGHGTLFLGLHRGFAQLLREGAIARMPRLHAIQSQAYAPVVDAYAPVADARAPEGRSRAAEGAHTIADGIRIADPARLRAMVDAVTQTGGSALAVTESAIAAALHAAARRGLLIEPTSAVAVAGSRQLALDGAITPGQSVVVPITGHGLKSLQESGQPST